MYFHGTEESKSSELMATIISNTSKGEVVEGVYPVIKVLRKLSADEYVAAGKQAKAKLPSLLKVFFIQVPFLTLYKLFEGDNVNYPPKELTAGDGISFVTVGIYDGQKPPQLISNKNLDKESKLILRVNCKEDKEIVWERSDITMYKPGLVAFKNIKGFSKAGIYELIATSTIKDLKEVTHL
jgi:hypothetical protein